MEDISNHKWEEKNIEGKYILPGVAYMGKFDKQTHEAISEPEIMFICILCIYKVE